MKKYTQTQGFSLLEIIVVLVIISIFVSISLVGLGDARENSQDKAMMTEFKQVQVALSLYKAQFGRYPAPGCGAGGLTPAALDKDDCGSTTDYITSFVPNFIAELPRATESANSDCDIEYKTDSGGSWFKLTAIDCLSEGFSLSQDDELARCPSGCSGGVCETTHSEFGQSFAIYSFNGQCQ